MRICIDARPLREVTTGLGRYTRSLVQHLAGIDPENEYILLRRPLYPGNVVEQDNFAEIRVPYGIFSPRNILTGARLINRLDADIYHSLFHFLPLGLKVRHVVVTLHDLIWVEHRVLAYEDRRRRWFKCGIAAPLIGRALAHADRVISISESTRQVALARFGLSPEKFTTIHHGVDPVFFSSRCCDCLPAICAGRPFIFTLSNTLPYKNTARLLDAFVSLTADYPRLCLLIAGRGDGYPTLVRLSRRYGIADRVLFSDQLTYAEVRACFARGIFFAFPSLVEGFGLPVLEAMASGCPVLTSNTSALVEVAGNDAELVDPHEVESIAAGMRRLLDSPERRRRLGAQGQRRAARFTWEACARQTLEVYRGLVQLSSEST